MLTAFESDRVEAGDLTPPDPDAVAWLEDRDWSHYWKDHGRHNLRFFSTVGFGFKTDIEHHLGYNNPLIIEPTKETLREIAKDFTGGSWAKVR